MKFVLRAVRAEQVKLRGTLALRLCFIAPALVVGLSVLQLLLVDSAQPMPTPELGWQRFAQGVLVLWSFLMLPLYITLQSALLAGLEHGGHLWKHLLALPVPRRAHYLGKAVVLAAMVLLAMLVLVLLILLGGKLLMMSNNSLGIGGSPPWRFLLTRGSAICAASFFIIALHLWIAIRWPSFTVAVASGMTATVAGFLIAQSARFGHWYPWSMPMQVLAGEGEKIGFVITAGLCGGVVVLLLGLRDFNRRDMAG